MMITEQQGETAFQTIFLEKKILDYKQNYSLRNGPSKFFFGGGGGYLSYQ